MKKNIETTRRADFSERALAFAADGALFAGAWTLTLKLAAPGEPLTDNPRGAAAGLLWLGVFLLYQAFFASDGRVTFGKRLLGLRVVGVDGQPLDLARSFVRSLGYLVSQFFTAGFLWALFDSGGRAWHDLPIGSRVVSDRPFGAGRRVVFRLATASMMIAFAAVWGWQNIWASRYHQIMTVAYAQHGLKEFVQLQKDYKLEHGRYAGSLFALATESVDPTGFLRGTVALYDQGRVGFSADRDHFTIVARANDVDKTMVAVSGP